MFMETYLIIVYDHTNGERKVAAHALVSAVGPCQSHVIEAVLTHSYQTYTVKNE